MVYNIVIKKIIIRKRGFADMNNNINNNNSGKDNNENPKNEKKYQALSGARNGEK